MRIDLLSRDELAAATLRNALIRLASPVWPGFQIGNIPMAVYTEGRRVVPVDHPSPPDGFSQVQTPVAIAWG